MPTLTISDELHRRIMALTNPLIGAEEVLSRLLDGIGAPAPARSVRRRRRALDRSAFVAEILHVLNEGGGSLPTTSIRGALWKRMEGQFDASMRNAVASDPRDPRWWNHARFARQWMVEQGLIERGGTHGVWTLSARGRLEAQRRASG